LQQGSARFPFPEEKENIQKNYPEDPVNLVQYKSKNIQINAEKIF